MRFCDNARKVYCVLRRTALRWVIMDPTKHTLGQLRVTPLRGSLSPLCEFSQSLKDTMYSFEAGEGYCGEAIGRPEKIGFSFTAVMTAADAARLKLCWDSHDALVAALDEAVILLHYHGHGVRSASEVMSIAKPQPDTEESTAGESK
jgi:hypothetical protein